MDETDTLAIPDSMGGLSSMLHISPSGLIAGLLFGIVGWWLFREGKKRLSFKITFIGIALMVYPYFTKGPWQDWGVGMALCAAAHYYWNE